MNISLAQQRALKAAIKRGKVNPSITTVSDIICHFTNEVAEFANAKDIGDIDAFERLAQKKGYDKYYVKIYKDFMAGTKADELADIILIAFTTAQMHGIDLERAINNKQRYNELR